MFSTIKGKIISLVILVMIACTMVNVYFTNHDVGNAMLAAQEKSAVNILHSINLLVKDAYHNLLSEKTSMTLSKRKQLQSAANIIQSVFNGYCSSVDDGLAKDRAIIHSLEWLKSAPFEKLNFHIISKESQILVSSNKSLTEENYKTLRDIKQRKISEIMHFTRLAEDGDFAAFSLASQDEDPQLALAYFLPMNQWGLTIVTAIDISNIEIEAQRKKSELIVAINDFARQLNIAESGFVYIFDAYKKTLVFSKESTTEISEHSLNALTGNTIQDDIIAATLSEKTDLHFVSSGDPSQQNMIAYFDYFKSLKWYINVIVPVKEIQKPAQLLVKRLGMVIMGVLIIGIVVIFYLVSRIAAPLNLLSSYAKDLPKTDFTKPLTKGSPIDALPERYKDEVGNLASSFILMRQELSDKVLDLLSITASRQKIESELTIAREIQLGMVPKSFPPFPEHEAFDLHATLLPAKEIGGDLYEFFLLDEDHLCFALGDVSDKGIPSALFMVVTRTLIKTLSEKTQSPATILHNINNILSEDNPRAMFVTLIIGVFNIKTGEIIYANGGHNPPVLISEKDSVRFLQGTNDPLVGGMPDMKYSNHTVVLPAGDSFFLYTDGVNEAMNTKGEQYSNKTLLQELSKCRTLTPKDTVQTIMAGIRRHSGAAPQSDDIAMLMLKYNGNAKQPGQH